VLSASVMIGVQPLASQFRPLFDGSSEDLSMSIPPSSLKEQELSSKVSELLYEAIKSSKASCKACFVRMCLTCDIFAGCIAPSPTKKRMV